MAEKEISEDLTLDDLEKVLKSLKNNKARDAHGHIYKLYKYAGYDLKFSMLRMFNVQSDEKEANLSNNFPTIQHIIILQEER